MDIQDIIEKQTKNTNAQHPVRLLQALGAEEADLLDAACRAARAELDRTAEQVRSSLEPHWIRQVEKGKLDLSPFGSTLVIPHGTKKIGRRAFSGCESLQTVVVKGKPECDREAFPMNVKIKT